MTLHLNHFQTSTKLIAWGCYLHHDTWELKVPTKQSPQRGVWKVGNIYHPGFPITYPPTSRRYFWSWWFSEFPVWWDRFPRSFGGQRLGSTKTVMTWLHETCPPYQLAATGKQRCCFRATSPQMIPIRANGCWTGSRFGRKTQKQEFIGSWNWIW